MSSAILRLVRVVVATLLLLAVIAGCSEPGNPTAPPASGAVNVDQAAAIQIATHIFQTAHPIGAAISNLTTKASLTAGTQPGPNAGHTVWLVQVDGDISQPPGATYTSHFLIEVDPASGAATVVGQG